QGWLGDLTPEAQRAVKVLPERAIRLGPTTPFQLRPVHLGGFHREPVRLHLVQDATAREILYDPAMFDFGDAKPPEPPGPETGFAGFRLFFPLGPEGGYDELLTFLGASYFRAVVRGARFGISGRGLALETGLGRPEEFPAFTRFWFVQPADRLDPLTVCALLESRSVAGAYRFIVTPRENTVMQVDASLFFRADVQQVGIAPLTSMFYLGPNDRVGTDDYRERVHDSDGLSVWRGGGEVVWRPLVNPGELRMSVFGDENPRGFGLLQRDRGVLAYDDLDARFDLRPNLWVEPKGAWGKGSVRLIEVPTPDETHDNIVAFWTPEAPARAGGELRLSYGLVWSFGPPLQTGLAPVLTTAIGRGGRPGDPNRPEGARRVAIDFAPGFGQGPGTQPPEVSLECRNGDCTPAVLQPNPGTEGWRVTFDAATGEGTELRCVLTQAGRPISETWLYRLDKT
ncbi:MAG TPA: glucan biosynthesis protein, partial [Geminicoccaceae bacterium]